MTSTLTQLRDECAGVARSPEYLAKMRHPVPNAPVVVREEFVLSRCAGKRVLDIGHSGPMGEGVRRVAEELWGIDHPRNDKGDIRPGVFYIDLDQHHAQLPNREIDIVLCGEVLEHLSNPGWLLDRIRNEYPGVPVLITVPNAYNANGPKWLAKGWELVNLDHVSWYSHRTLTTLLERHGYRIAEFCWYRGKPKFSEGMIAVAEEAG